MTELTLLHKSTGGERHLALIRRLHFFEEAESAGLTSLRAHRKCAVIAIDSFARKYRSGAGHYHANISRQRAEGVRLTAAYLSNPETTRSHFR
jgi:hypothetical protein